MGARRRRPPARPGRREGLWTCRHGPCPVQVLRLWVREPQAAHLPRLRCPVCLRILLFRRWRGSAWPGGTQ